VSVHHGSITSKGCYIRRRISQRRRAGSVRGDGRGPGGWAVSYTVLWGTDRQARSAFHAGAPDPSQIPFRYHRPDLGIPLWGQRHA